MVDDGRAGSYMALQNGYQITKTNSQHKRYGMTMVGKEILEKLQGGQVHMCDELIA
jgi:predicted transcriptional regulator